MRKRILIQLQKLLYLFFYLCSQGVRISALLQKITKIFWALFYRPSNGTLRAPFWYGLFFSLMSFACPITLAYLKCVGLLVRIVHEQMAKGPQWNPMGSCPPAVIKLRSPYCFYGCSHMCQRWRHSIHRYNKRFQVCKIPLLRVPSKYIFHVFHFWVKYVKKRSFDKNSY